MRTRTIGILIATSLAVFFCFIGCEKAGPLVLTEIGPTKTKAGVVFNAQPDNEAAMWIKAENATESTVAIWGEKQIPTYFKDSKYLTASVPKELYAKAGQNQVYLKDKKTGTKSNSMTFTVE